MTPQREGQYQIGNVVFGSGTQYMLQSLEATGYTISAGDFAVPMTDEMRFRKDYLQPGQLLLTIGAMDNYLVSGAPHSFLSANQLIETFVTEWKSDDIRKIWGFVKPLVYKRDGKVRRVYGRPRDVASAPRKKKPGWHDIVCTYQRVDTLSYSEEEYGAVNFSPTAVGVNTTSIVRRDGSAPTWMNIFITGPITNPVLDIGPYKLEIQHTLLAGQTIAISSHPWDRRAVSSAGPNLAPKLINNSPYLDELVFPAGATYAVGLHGSATTSATKCTISWREAFNTF